jgi:hypothetical protein
MLAIKMIGKYEEQGYVKQENEKQKYTDANLTSRMKAVVDFLNILTIDVRVDFGRGYIRVSK